MVICSRATGFDTTPYRNKLELFGPPGYDLPARFKQFLFIFAVQLFTLFKMKSFFLILLGVYIIGNLYIFIRFLQTVGHLGCPTKITLSILFWIAALSLIISLAGRDILPDLLRKILYFGGSIWLVFTLYMVISLLALDLIKLTTGLIRYPFFTAFGITALLLLYGYVNYRHPKVERIGLDLPYSQESKINNFGKSGEIKIAAISDVHLGDLTGKRALSKYADLINSLEPDIILIAGDLIDNSVKPLYKTNMAEELNKLNAPMGIYMVPGNHEYISGIGETEKFLAATKIRLLRDSVIALPCGIDIIGRDDHSNRNRASKEELLGKCINRECAILLDHQPYNLAESDSLKIFLQFSGHTHHGQIWPISLITEKLYEQSHGYRKWNNSHIYVSSGLSLWGPPFRIGTRSDMALFTINLHSDSPCDGK